MSGKAKWEKDQEELHELQDEQATRRFAHRGPEQHENVVVTVEKDGELGSKDVGAIHVVGGRAFVKVDAEFDQQDLHVFSQQIQKAFQAVQV